MPPTLVFVIGPPAVGKTTVGRELAARIVRERGGRVVYAELEAPQEERLRRNATEFRLAEKPFKRDLAASRANLLALDAGYQLSSRGAFDDREDWLRLDSARLSPSEAAERIIERFGLARAG